MMPLGGGNPSAGEERPENKPIPARLEKQTGTEYGTGNERERGIVSAPLRKTNRERVQGERFYVTIYYVLIKRKENHSRPDALQTGTDFQTAPAPLTTVFERRGVEPGDARGKLSGGYGRCRKRINSRYCWR